MLMMQNEFFQLAIDAVEADKVEVPFDYYGHTPGNPELAPQRRVEPMKKEDLNTGLITVTPDEETGKLKVKIPPLTSLNEKTKTYCFRTWRMPWLWYFLWTRIIL